MTQSLPNPLKKVFHTCLLGLLSLQLNACVATVYTWKEAPDYEQIRVATTPEKVEFYEKYAIKSLIVNDVGIIGGSATFSTYAEPNKTYEFYSFAPTLHAIYPESEAHLEEILFYEKAEIISFSSWLALLIGTSTLQVQARRAAAQTPASTANDEVISTVTLLTLLGSGLVWVFLETYFASQKRQAYMRLQEEYNAALVKHLLLSPDSLTQAIPEPTLAIK